MAGEEYVSYSDYLMLQRERDEAIARSKEWSDWCVEYKSELEEAQKDTKILSRRMKTLWDSSEKVCRERDELLKECMQMSIEFGLPPTIRPADGEIRRMINGWKQAIVERDEARHNLELCMAANSDVARIARERDEAREAAAKWEAIALREASINGSRIFGEEDAK
jgi:hypothetical protein